MEQLDGNWLVARSGPPVRTQMQLTAQIRRGTSEYADEVESLLQQVAGDALGLAPRPWRRLDLPTRSTHGTAPNRKPAARWWAATIVLIVAAAVVVAHAARNGPNSDDASARDSDPSLGTMRLPGGCLLRSAEPEPP